MLFKLQHSVRCCGHRHIRLGRLSCVPLILESGEWEHVSVARHADRDHPQGVKVREQHRGVEGLRTKAHLDRCLMFDSAVTMLCKTGR